jgi:hypothetical protein
MIDNRPVVAFVHTYAADGSFDPFMSSLMEAFAQEGARLYVIKTNDLVHSLAAKSLSRAISQDKLLATLRAIDPAFILSTNRGGISRRIMQELSCPIISWLVDHVPFEHVGDGGPLFCSRDHVVVSAARMVETIEKRYPEVKGRVHYLPFATRLDADPLPAGAQDIGVSFVGTFFHGNEFLNLLRAYRRDPAVSAALLSVAEAVAGDFRTDTTTLIDRLGLAPVLAQNRMSARDLEMAMANVASMNKRIRALDAIADLGLHLWGTENWLDAAVFSLPLLRCYRFGEFIRTREQLSEVYRRSRIAIDVPHIQAVGGLPYRVFDILASPALLITEFHEESDLFRLFGKDVPVPMYRDPDELRALVKHYHSHEDERRQLVARSNALVKGHTFRDRVKSLFSIAQMKPASAATSTCDDRCGVTADGSASPLGQMPSFAGEVIQLPVAMYSRAGFFLRHSAARRQIADVIAALLLIFPLATAHLLLSYLSPSMIRSIARLVRRTLPEPMFRWVVRELIVGETTGRVVLLQENLRDKLKAGMQERRDRV